MHLFVDILLMITLEGPVNSDQSIEVQLVIKAFLKKNINECVPYKVHYSIPSFTIVSIYKEPLLILNSAWNKDFSLKTLYHPECYNLVFGH